MWASGLAPNRSSTSAQNIDPMDSTWLADLTGDGLDDAVVWDATTGGGIRVAPSDGSRFAAAPLLHELGCTAPPAVAALHGDATGDGRADVACVGASTGWSVAEGTHGGGQILGSLRPWSSVMPLAGVGVRRWLADVNNDSKADAVEFSPVAGWWVQLSNGSAFAGPATNWAATSAPCANGSAVFASDVDADGCADAVCVGGRDSCWQVALSNCQNGFGPPRNWRCGLPSSQLEPTTHALVLGRATGTATRTSDSSDSGVTVAAEGGGRGRFLMADIDNNGAQDALFFTATNGVATWYAARSDKSGSFAAQWWPMMTQHGEVMRHGKPMGGPIAEVFMIISAVRLSSF